MGNYFLIFEKLNLTVHFHHGNFNKPNTFLFQVFFFFASTRPLDISFFFLTVMDFQRNLGKPITDILKVLIQVFMEHMERSKW